MSNHCAKLGVARFVLALVSIVFLSGCQKELYSNVPEAEATEMWAILLRNNISSDKVGKRGNFKLLVEKSQIPDAVEILKECGLPRTKFDSVPSLFQEGMISSPLEEQARYQYALNQSLAETLSIIDGVITAKVHVVLPDNKPFAEVKKHSSASVMIKHREDVSLENVKSQIKLNVAKSVEGLNYEDVTIAMVAADQGNRCVGGVSARPIAVRYAQAGLVSQTALWMLASLFGLFAVSVAVTRYRSHKSDGVARVVSRHGERAANNQNER